LLLAASCILGVARSESEFVFIPLVGSQLHSLTDLYPNLELGVRNLGGIPFTLGNYCLIDPGYSLTVNKHVTSAYLLIDGIDILDNLKDTVPLRIEFRFSDGSTIVLDLKVGYNLRNYRTMRFWSLADPSIRPVTTVVANNIQLVHEENETNTWNELQDGKIVQRLIVDALYIDMLRIDFPSKNQSVLLNSIRFLDGPQPGALIALYAVTLQNTMEPTAVLPPVTSPSIDLSYVLGTIAFAVSGTWAFFILRHTRARPIPRSPTSVHEEIEAWLADATIETRRYIREIESSGYNNIDT
jgi:hypothetical protein